MADEDRLILDRIRTLYRARPFQPFLIETTAGERHEVRQPESIAFSPETGVMVLRAGSDPFVRVEMTDIADVGEIVGVEPEATDPTPPAEDREELLADLWRLRGRIDGVEADVRRGDFALRRDIQQRDHDLRGEFQRGHLDQRSDLYMLKFWVGLQGCLLGVLLFVLFIGPGPSFYWTGTIDSQVKIHDRRIDQIEAKSAERHAAIGDRLDELRAAIRQANDRTSPPR
jgi:hypothetical protein